MSTLNTVIVGQNEALELALHGAPLEKILEVLVYTAESQSDEKIYASIHLLNDENRLTIGAAPSLPKEFNDRVEGMKIGPSAGSCGTAAFKAKSVVVTDIAKDPLWKDFKDVALKHDLKSCWSTPILSAQKKVLGTFAIYSNEIRNPSPKDHEVVDLITRTAALVIERHHEAQAHLSAQTQFKIAVEAANMGTWECNPHTLIVNWSKRTNEMFGLPPCANVPFERVMNCIHPEDQERVRKAVAKAIDPKSKGNYHVDYRIQLPNNEVRWISAIGKVFFAKTHKVKIPMHFSGVVVDVSERMLAEENLRKAKEAAEFANNAKSSFLANMSHEIRTPLGAIMGFVSLLRDKRIHPSEMENFLAVIDKNSHQLLRIIDDILDLAKVEAGMMTTESLRFSLVELLTDFSSLMRLRAKEHHIQFELKVVTALPKYILSDSTRIRQILTNVVGNAIKFTEKGFVKVNVSYFNGFLEFEVIDTGKGIAPEQIPNLFQPFSQGDPSITRKYGGTGLGLVLTRSLTEALGGSFVLKETALGKGSTFVARIQVIAEEIPYLQNTQVQASSEQLQNMNILLVEDSPDNQSLISLFLKRAGASIDIAQNGEQGCQMANDNNYDLVLMDLQMPVMDGMTAITTLRSQGYKQPIIALTAHAMKEEKNRCLQAGCNDFLSKPIMRESLVNTLSHYKSDIAH